MPSIDRGDRVLSSDWTGLSRHLIAAIFPVKRVVEGTNVRWERVPNSIEVQAPLTEGSLEQTVQWTSPFENQTADAKLSSLSSMFQTGGFEAIMNSLQEMFGKESGVGGVLNTQSANLKALEGRSAVTKLNSTQVFTGMPPFRLNVALYFRALFDAQAEVENPMDQLMSWAVPQHLAAQGIVGNALDPHVEGAVRSFYASEIPQVLGMVYANRLFKPIVIEAAPYPLVGPRNENGDLIMGAMSLSLASLTAIDKDDWAQTRRF